MAVKKFKPTSPGRRFMVAPAYDDITVASPEKSLTAPLKKTGGRNAQGRVTARHRGGGNKRLYRIIDFKRDKQGIPARVATIEYDPNRSARIALLNYADGEKRYIVAPQGLKVGATVISGTGVDISPGNSMPLRYIPSGSFIHNIELKPGRGGQIVRSAGGSAQLLAKEGNYAHLRLPSGEVRLVHLDCMATVGQIGNMEHSLISHGKAGKKRWLGSRPAVRGVVMNPNDHPHGGGEGKAPIGRKSPVSPWGKPTLGYKTRKRKPSDSMIVRKRK